MLNQNEADIQLKEKYRGVVRLELESMERRYIDMASILRALGIAAEGGEVYYSYSTYLFLIVVKLLFAAVFLLVISYLSLQYNIKC